MAWSVEEVAPGNAGAYASLARLFDTTSTIADDALQAINAIRNNVDSSIWTGTAADAFRDEIGKLPAQLDKLAVSYRTAGSALSTYGTTLQSLKTRAWSACIEGADAEQDEASHAAGRASAAAVARAPEDPPPDLSGYDNAIAAAQARIRAARNQLSEISSERRAAESSCCDELHTAHEQGIKNDSWWKHALKTALSVIGKVCQILAVVLLVIAIVVILVVAGWAIAAGAGIFAALIAGVVAAGELLGTIMLAVAAVGLAVSVTQKVMGDSDRSWASIIFEGVLLAAPFALGKIASLAGASGAAGAFDSLAARFPSAARALGWLRSTFVEGSELGTAFVNGEKAASVVGSFRDEAWIAKNLPTDYLTKTEHDALVAWSQPDTWHDLNYTDINKYIWNGTPPRPTVSATEIQSAIDAIDSSMRPIPADITVTRASSAYDLNLGPGETPADAIGRVISKPGFTATSANPTPPWKGEIRWKIDLPAGTPAVNLEGVSVYTGTGEREILLPRNLKLEILTAVQDANGIWDVTARLIP